ncbi:MAG: hypothetical protein WCA35_29505, partial [Kovacikia sp.]
VQLSSEVFRADRDRVYAPDLRQGDALFWHPNTIHGALPTVDPQYSRKSSTAHYIPSELKGGNSWRVFENMVTQKFQGMEYVVTHRPDVEVYKPVSLSTTTRSIENRRVRFLNVQTAMGRTVLAFDSIVEQQALKEFLETALDGGAE